MKKLAFGALMIGLLSTALAACGGGDDNPDFIDSGVPDAGGGDACNAAENTGCGANEKCTWINIDSDANLGTVGCVPDGTVPIDGACMYGEDGESTGYDDCVGGNICISGACEPICTISPDNCDATRSCARYEGLFEGSTPELGACDYVCDPVTQERADGAAVCNGTGTGIDATRGCNGFFDGDFTCAGVPATVAANPGMFQQDDDPYGPASGGAYLNGCAPGFAPTWVLENTKTATLVCMAYCDPVDTSAESPGGLGGASPHSCGDRNALNHQCTYFWIFETWDQTTQPPHPDNVGFCWNPDQFIGDWDGDATTPDEPWPRCDTISTAEEGYNTWGCNAYNFSLHGTITPKKLPFRPAETVLQYNK